MLIKAKALTGYTLKCLDGEIGRVKEFYFDDRHWTIRYLVDDTGNWLKDRQVLISPYALKAVLRKEQHIEIELTKKQIEDSPPWQNDKPVSRQFEESYYGYHAWPMYWDGLKSWGYFSCPMRDREKGKEPIQSQTTGDHHLRSTHTVRGYHIEATDGPLGQIDDFIIDDKSWAIRYLAVGTRNWWPGKKILLSPQWIDRVNWEESKIFVTLSRETIRQSPENTSSSRC